MRISPVSVSADRSVCVAVSDLVAAMPIIIRKPASTRAIDFMFSGFVMRYISGAPPSVKPTKSEYIAAFWLVTSQCMSPAHDTKLSAATPKRIARKIAFRLVKRSRVASAMLLTNSS